LSGQHLHLQPAIAICVVGWHFQTPFYAQLSQLTDVAIYVVSHQPPAAVPSEIYAYLPPGNFVFAKNQGYDWGCFQQFLELGHWRAYDYIFFIHDDVVIKDAGFVPKCVELLDAGHSVVGNGRGAPPLNWPRISTPCYAHATFKPAPDFVHDAVRGSFLATTRAALEKLGTFEVYWDPWQLTSGFGNWSTRASCAKWQYLCGERCFEFLSETYCESDYLLEYVRGGAEEGSEDPRDKRKRIAIAIITRLATIYMHLYWRTDARPWRAIALGMLTPFLRLASARR
jgi:hypothetical protein